MKSKLIILTFLFSFALLAANNKQSTPKNINNSLAKSTEDYIIGSAKKTQTPGGCLETQIKEVKIFVCQYQPQRKIIQKLKSCDVKIYRLRSDGAWGKEWKYEDTEYDIYNPKTCEKGTIYDPIFDDTKGVIVNQQYEDVELQNVYVWKKFPITDVNECLKMQIQAYTSALKNKQTAALWKIFNITQATFTLKHNIDDKIKETPNVGMSIENDPFISFDIYLDADNNCHSLTEIEINQQLEDWSNRDSINGSIRTLRAKQTIEDLFE